MSGDPDSGAAKGGREMREESRREQCLVLKSEMNALCPEVGVHGLGITLATESHHTRKIT